MMTLALLSVFHFFFARDTFLDCGKKVINNTPKKKSKPNNIEKDIKDKINSLLVVATLIAGVSFAASVQIAGSNSSESKGDSPPSPPPSPSPSSLHLRYERQLKVFTECNTIAMYTSISAAITLCWTQLQDMHPATVGVRLASALIAIALYMSCVAFIYSVTMLRDIGNMIVFEALCLCSLGLAVPFLPFQVKKVFIIAGYYFFASIYYGFHFCFYVLPKWWWCCCCCCHRKQKE